MQQKARDRQSGGQMSVVADKILQIRIPINYGIYHNIDAGKVLLLADYKVNYQVFLYMSDIFLQK